MEKGKKKYLIREAIVESENLDRKKLRLKREIADLKKQKLDTLKDEKKCNHSKWKDVPVRYALVCTKCNKIVGHLVKKVGEGVKQNGKR